MSPQNNFYDCDALYKTVIHATYLESKSKL